MRILKSDMPLNEIVALLRRYREQGVTQGEVYAFLEALHHAAPDEATDDRILERISWPAFVRRT